MAFVVDDDMKIKDRKMNIKMTETCDTIQKR